MGAVDYFLKIDGVKGESQDSKHKDEIDVLSYSWGVANTSSHAAGGGGAGMAVPATFVVVKYQDRASPLLFRAAARGEHIKQGLLTARRAGKEQLEFLNIWLGDVLVNEYKLAGAVNEQGRPTEQVSLSFAAINFTYREQKPDGSLGGEVKATWDFKANKGG